MILQDKVALVISTQIFRENTMKAFLNRSTILAALAISMTLYFALPASADSTANLLLNLQFALADTTSIYGKLKNQENSFIAQAVPMEI